ncbi:hypothetical protein HBI22_162240 [Parastagonospora nodorum]|nr:hypothetical protein HBI28_189430 [Parastagonospora nodorum]KAH5625072.1 hypothetical protein HBI22_162240 [Parastagonospora nodorum]
MISSNSMSQTNVREGYRITTLEVVELVEDLISYLLKSLRSLTLKDWLAVAKCIRLRNAQIPKYGAKVKIEDLSNTLTLTLSKTAQRQSLSVVSNRSTASITDKFGVALLTEPAILNDANVALVDAVHYSVVKQFSMFRLMTKESQQKLEENYFEVIDALTMTLIKDNDDLLGTVNSYIKLRRLGARRKTEAADSRHAKASGGRTKKDKDSEDSDTSSDVLRSRRRDRAAACARSAERKRLGKEAQLKKTRDEEELAKAKKEKEEKEARETRDGLSARVGTAIEHCTLEEWTSAAVFFGLTDAYILYFKELLSDNSGIFANAIGMGKTRAIVLAVLIGHVHFKNWTEVQNARAEGDAIEHNAVDDDNKLCPTEGERTFYCADLLALRFCFFSNSPPENIGRLTKEEAIEMRIDTTDAISKALAAANKLTIPEANTPAVYSEATKHRLALLAAQFVIVCSFGKVDKHVFRAYNTMSVTAQRTIIRKGGPYVEKRAILLPSHVTVWGRTVFDEFYNCKSEGIIMANLQNRKGVSNWFNATDKRDSVTGDRIYKMEDAVYRCLCLDFLSTVQNAEQQCRDILEKEGLNELEASRRVIFNRFEMQAIFKIYGSCKVKRFTLNSVKDLFTNLSKDYFLVREARAITKSSLNIAAEDAAKAANILLPLKEVRAKILIESYKLIVQALAEMCVSIVYFNLDSKLELKVLEALC